MTEVVGTGGDNAPSMASWDDSGPPLDTGPLSAGPDPGSARASERVRRLLKQLLAKRPADDWSALPMVPELGGERPMKLLVTHPELAPALVSALNDTDCVATRTSSYTVDVLVPWRLDDSNRTHAATELLFFVRAWGAKHPAFRATLIAVT
jgi:hypothetical protein